MKIRINRYPHSNLCGIYGDKINALHCLDCRRYLDGPPVLAKMRRDELEA